MPDKDEDSKRTTTKIRRKLRPTSGRLRDLSELRTRKITVDGISSRDLEDLFTRLHNYHIHAGKLHEASNLKELFQSALSAIGTLFDLHYFQVLERNLAGEYVPGEIGSAPPELAENKDAYDDLVNWALQEKQVLFYELDKSEIDDVTTIGIMPITGDATPPQRRSALDGSAGHRHERTASRYATGIGTGFSGT